MAITTLDQLGILLVTGAAYLLGLVVYRLYFSPLAKFPGPKIAAATLWYEFIYDVRKQGRYLWKIAEMHEKYGPIVRINPYELHINDPDYYDELYIHGPRRTDKYEWQMKAFGPQTSTFQTLNHDLHRARRNAVAPFFSTASVARIEPLIQTDIEKLNARFRDARKTGVVIDLFHAFLALTNDIICEYAFGSPQGWLEQPELGRDWAEAMFNALKMSPVFKQFGWLSKLMRSMPRSVANKMNPRLATFMSISTICQKRVEDLRAETKDGKESPNQRTIFSELMTNKQLSEMDKSDMRLVGEGRSVMTAGAHFSYQVEYNRPHPSHHSLPPDQRPKVAREPASRAGSYPRDVETTAQVVRARETAVSGALTIQHISLPYILQITDDVQNAIITEGLSLAYCELYLTIASVFAPGKFNFELYETDDSDVEIVHDLFAPFARLDSKGIRVKVL
ncbi:uncharacterized protein KY384_000814 [Bacidia gigantensis]|uniref:uncharacterized protein n=1 Tax=Bacidia gigantensis TaxID=2732470 RepID=UPI001D04CCB4|nr:uncharacterized protein KY384_000814 [Bacidia gigantensis]KAG8526052.1 hypothetical protein KY384_000814 [Bacidia gigantensis]